MDSLLLPLLSSGAATDFLLPMEHGDNVKIFDQTTVLRHKIRTNLTLLPHSLVQETFSLQRPLDQSKNLLLL